MIERGYSFFNRLRSRMVFSIIVVWFLCAFPDGIHGYRSARLSGFLDERKNWLFVLSFVNPWVIPGSLRGFARTDTSCFAWSPGDTGCSRRGIQKNAGGGGCSPGAATVVHYWTRITNPPIMVAWGGIWTSGKQGESEKGGMNGVSSRVDPGDWRANWSEFHFRKNDSHI